VLKPCLGCGRPTKGSRCTECQRAVWRQRQATRDPGPVAIYKSAEWRRLADAVVAEAIGCHWCRRQGVRLTADHIVAMTVDLSLALEPSNVVAACYSCQNTRAAEHRRPRAW
jgi:5-methylcytosine-specific restriction endonuclease McrA